MSLSVSNNISFQSNKSKLITELPTVKKGLATLLSIQEGDQALSHIRFIQDTSTNWLPKVPFSRSIADFTEFTFIQGVESPLFYYVPSLLGNKVKNFFSKKLPHFKEDLERPLSEVKDKRALPLKAAIILASICIPAAEYAMSFAKNLLTLKLFKKSDFSNIVGLDKNKQETKEQQDKVKNSAQKHILGSVIAAIAGFASAALLAKYGRNSKNLQGLSEIILEPGAKLNNLLNKIGLKSEKVEKFLKKYIKLDFDYKEVINKKGEKETKLGLSHGQLAASVITGVVSYFIAAKDRGKLDFYEVASRLPLVAAYTIFGSAFLESSFNKWLYYRGKAANILHKENGEIKVRTLAELIKQHDGKLKPNSPEWNKVFNEKALVSLAPFTFSVVVMGFTLAGISRFWTKYRFNHGVGQENKQRTKTDTLTTFSNSQSAYKKDIFKAFAQ